MFVILTVRIVCQHHPVLHLGDNGCILIVNFVGFDEIINAHNVSKLIIGLPLDKGGKAQEMTFIAKSFGRKLANRYNIETVFIDEYLSSFDAKKQLKYNHYHPNAKRGDVDKQSSQLILQTWLNEKRLD
jgi:putative Holliday junction resolvase